MRHHVPFRAVDLHGRVQPLPPRWLAVPEPDHNLRVYRLRHGGRATGPGTHSTRRCAAVSRSPSARCSSRVILPVASRPRHPRGMLPRSSRSRCRDRPALSPEGADPGERVTVKAACRPGSERHIPWSLWLMLGLFLMTYVLAVCSADPQSLPGRAGHRRGRRSGARGPGQGYAGGCGCHHTQQFSRWPADGTVHDVNFLSARLGHHRNRIDPGDTCASVKHFAR